MAPDSPILVAQLVTGVLDSLADGRVSDAQASAERLYEVVHGEGGVGLLRDGISEQELAALQGRVDTVRGLLSRPGRAQAAGQAANRVLETLGGVTAHDGAPAWLPNLIRLTHLEHEVELRSEARQWAATHAAVRGLRAAWEDVRADVDGAGGKDVADRFEQHVHELERSDGPAAIRREAPVGRAAIREMARLLGDGATSTGPGQHPHPTLDRAGAWHPLSGTT
jgi:hypothetical protein